MRFFLAGIMQGSLVHKALHDQDYRSHLKKLLLEHFPGSDVYDPLTDHKDSINYGPGRGKQVFFEHNRMCGEEIDVLIAFIPEASMGTAVEMWEAYRHGRVVISISPLTHNWAVKFLSHEIYPDLKACEAALASGELARKIEEVLQEQKQE
jgi:hypothetical protein